MTLVILLLLYLFTNTPLCLYSVQGSHDKVKSSIENVNKKRKFDQVEMGKKLSLLQEEFVRTAINNVQIDAECTALEQQIKRFRSAAEDRKLTQMQQ